MTHSKSLLANAPLFIVIFIDSMGIGLLFPILNSIIVDPASVFLPHSVSLSHRDYLYGVIVSVYMLCWFFGAAILGDLSDKVGRKKALTICLFGSFFGYLLSGIAIFMHSLTVLVIGRIIAGFTAGSQPIAQAAIIDISSDEQKARNIGFILLWISLGFVFGPIFGGVLSDSQLISWFNFTTPMYFAAIISLLNALLLIFFFQETYKVTGKFRIRFHQAINIFVSAFKSNRIRYLSIVFLVMILGWSDYYTFISMFLVRQYGATPLSVALFMAVMGCGFSVGCGILVDYFTKRYPLKILIIFGVILASVATFITFLCHEEWMAWVLTFFIALFIAVAYSVMLTVFSNQVDQTEQGWVMGVTGSIVALAFGINSLLTGAIAEHLVLPLLISAIGMGVAGILMMFYKNRKDKIELANPD